jgi:hypothetical protein
MICWFEFSIRGNPCPSVVKNSGQSSGSSIRLTKKNTKHTKGREGKVRVKVKETGETTSATSAAFCKIWIEVLTANGANDRELGRRNL